MPSSVIEPSVTSNRRSFLTKGVVAGVAGAGIAMLPGTSHLFAQIPEEDGGPLWKGDAALLRFAAAAELLEAARVASVRRRFKAPYALSRRILSIRSTDW